MCACARLCSFWRETPICLRLATLSRCLEMAASALRREMTIAHSSPASSSRAFAAVLSTRRLLAVQGVTTGLDVSEKLVAGQIPRCAYVALPHLHRCMCVYMIDTHESDDIRIYSKLIRVSMRTDTTYLTHICSIVYLCKHHQPTHGHARTPFFPPPRTSHVLLLPRSDLLYAINPRALLLHTSPPTSPQPLRSSRPLRHRDFLGLSAGPVARAVEAVLFWTFPY